jgi:hypothetical protein
MRIAAAMAFGRFLPRVDAVDPSHGPDADDGLDASDVADADVADGRDEPPCVLPRERSVAAVAAG